MKSREVRFLLNGQPVVLSWVDPNQTVLNYLRRQAMLAGTKEGCAEGDCGACMIALAEPNGDGDGELHWRAINACIRLLSSIDGLAIVTVDGLQTGSGELHPVQQAMIDTHASQCGFCTPGFVMSLFAAYQGGRGIPIDRPDVDTILSGNLCRCTGYRPIIDAAVAVCASVDGAVVAELNRSTKAGLRDLLSTDVRSDQSHSDFNRHPGEGPIESVRPQTVDQLLKARAVRPDSQLIAGCTDIGLWVTKQHRRFAQTIDVTSVTELRQVRRTGDGQLRIGAAARLTEAWDALVANWPQLSVYAARFASLPIRNSGTLGGNIANGSPIGDSMPLLMALGCRVTLANVQRERVLALESLYAGRQQTTMEKDEVLLWIDVDAPAPGDFVAAYKVCKRFDQDISALCLCVRIALAQTPGAVEPAIIERVRIGVGGMAAVPMRATKTEQVLLGAPWSEATVDKAASVLRSEFSPITDLRASEAYRRRVIGSLLIRAWRESAGQLVNLEALG